MTGQDPCPASSARALGRALGLGHAPGLESASPASSTMRPEIYGSPESPTPAEVEAYTRFWGGGPGNRGGTPKGV